MHAETFLQLGSERASDPRDIITSLQLHRVPRSPWHKMLAHKVLAPSLRLFHKPQPLSRFTTLTPHLSKPLPPRPIIPETDITESFLKGTGPGGQKINKTSSAVQLKHLPTGIVVKCQGTRSREQNRRTARKLLGERLEELEKGDQARTVVKRAEQGKRKASGEKKRRRKYRRLEEEKAAAEDGAKHEGVESGNERGEGGAVREEMARQNSQGQPAEFHRPP